VAVVQVYADFRAEQRLVDSNIDKIFRVTRNAVQRSVHLLDNRLAEEVVVGLRNYDYLAKVVIFDDRDQIMADYEAPSRESSTLWFTHLVVDNDKKYIEPLVYQDGTYEGKFALTINYDIALASFYDRAMYVFISGLLRNVSLALILMLFYHYALTRPLSQIANRFSQIDAKRPRGDRIDYLEDHQHDELGSIVDAANHFIAALEQRQSDLEESENQLRIIIDASPTQVFAVNKTGDFVFLNSATADFYGKRVDDLIGENYHTVHQVLNVEEADELLVIVKRVESTRARWMNLEKKITGISSREKLVVQMSCIPFDFYGQSCVLVVCNDITARVRAEERVERLAYYDALTNLPNRNLLYDRLTRDVEQTRQKGAHGALLFIDLDDFKRINDTMGHLLGDHLLLHLSKEMQTQIRQTDTLARLGGDEFTLSLPNLSADISTAQQQASELAERLIAIIGSPITLDKHEFLIGASIGIAMYPESTEETGELLRYADTAMYQAKNSGRGCFRFFHESMEIEAKRRVSLEADVRKALEESQFTFYLQPILASGSRQLMVAEALLRWPHPEKGMIMPGDYISYLEDSGMISTVGHVVLDNVCQYLQQQRQYRRVPDHFRIAVNISTKQFYQPGFVNQVSALLMKYDVPGSCLEFEITESAALQRLNDAVQTINQLRYLGITFSLDDFGTGYSSLSYLKQLPVEKIKIDRSFINDLNVDPQGEALVASIIAIARNLHLHVVAEGVETEEQVQWLARYPEVMYQGYLFDKPMPAAEFSEKYLLPKEQNTA